MSKVKPFYIVVEDNQDEYGYGDYLAQKECKTLEEAKEYLKNHPSCTGIDYWNGEKWEYNL